MDPILLIDKLSKLQRRAPRVITGGTYDVRPMHRNITIEQSLKNREVMTFKALRGPLSKIHPSVFGRKNKFSSYFVYELDFGQY